MAAWGFATASVVDAGLEQRRRVEQQRRRVEQWQRFAEWAQRPTVGDVLWPHNERACLSQRELRRACLEREDAQVAHDAKRIKRRISTAERRRLRAKRMLPQLVCY